MSIRLDEIKDPRLRARIEDALGAGGAGKRPAHDDEQPARPSRRIQQATKSKLTQLEQQALEWLRTGNSTGYSLRPHALRLELANGCVYTPDIIGESVGLPTLRLRAWEVKGKHAWDDSIVKLKVAARSWPSIQFILVWKQDGQWMTQEVQP